MTADPAEISRRLTKAQKRALLWLPAEWGVCSSPSDHDHPEWRPLADLNKKELAYRVEDDGWMLSILGTQVRAIVEQGGGNG